MTTEPDDQPTCGKGIAASAALPAKVGELIAATAEVLERHTRALDLTDPAAREERDAYVALVGAHRDVAGALDRLARQMAGCRDLPVARHDEAAMAAPDGQGAAFERYVAVERELVTLLTAKLQEDEQMLG
jgi:hypothetical protein